MTDLHHQFLIFLGRKIREIREKKGMTQEDLGKHLKIHRTYVGMVERGEKNVSVVSLKRFAQSLGVQMKDLIDF